MDSRSNSRRRLYRACKDLKRWIGCEPFFEPDGFGAANGDPDHRASLVVGAVLAVFLTENALMIFGLSSKNFCELLPGFPGEGY